MTILDVRGLGKTFALHLLGRPLTAFAGVNFRLTAGEFLLVSGPNGSGKSSLLRCLYRTYLPTAGSITYHSGHGPIDLANAADVDVSELRRQEIGFVTQFLRPRPRVTALELVAEPLTSDEVNWETARAEAGMLLTQLGLKRELWDAYPTTFSGGEQQKVNLARALVRRRRLLLLDEPTASLDADARDALTALLARRKAAGTAMIGVFHHPEDVASLVDNQLSLGSH